MREYKRYKGWITLTIILVALLFLNGCGIVFYNPISSGGEEFDVNVIKNVLQWLKYYTEIEYITGIEALIYPYSPNYNEIKREYEELFGSCDNIQWIYSITNITLQEDKKALVIGEELFKTSCGEIRGEMYIVMKQGDDGTWYIYDKQGINFNE